MLLISLKIFFFFINNICIIYYIIWQERNVRNIRQGSVNAGVESLWCIHLSIKVNPASGAIHKNTQVNVVKAEMNAVTLLVGCSSNFF